MKDLIQRNFFFSLTKINRIYFKQNITVSQGNWLDLFT